MLIAEATNTVEWIMSKAFPYTNTAMAVVKEPAIAMRIAQAWLVMGGLAAGCVPALRERSEWIGWLPLWLVIMPAAALVFLRWRSLLTASCKVWNRFSHRRAGASRHRPRRVRKTARPRRSERPAGAAIAAFPLR